MGPVQASNLLNETHTYTLESQFQINDSKIYIAYKVLQIIVIVYWIGYAILWSKSYQSEETGYCSTVVKIKGAILTENRLKSDNKKFKVYDTVDISDPPNVDSSFFIGTSYIETDKQIQSLCVDKESICINNADCPKLATSYQMNNINTGSCIRKEKNKTEGNCEVFGWCPVEYELEKNKIYLGKDDLSDLENFTIFIKSSVNFFKVNYQTNNIPDSYSKQNLSNCRYNSSSTDIFGISCPIIPLKEIFDQTLLHRNYVSKYGAHIGIVIRWNCDLDHLLWQKQCLPTYHFIRIDEYSSDAMSHGYNYRYADYDFMNAHSATVRTLRKMYGIKFQLITHAKARKFNLTLLLLNIGSGIGLFGITTMAVNYYITNWSPYKNLVITKVQPKEENYDDKTPSDAHAKE